MLPPPSPQARELLRKVLGHWVVAAVGTLLAFLATLLWIWATRGPREALGEVSPNVTWGLIFPGLSVIVTGGLVWIGIRANAKAATAFGVVDLHKDLSTGRMVNGLGVLQRACFRLRDPVTPESVWAHIKAESLVEGGMLTREEAEEGKAWAPDLIRAWESAGVVHPRTGRLRRRLIRRMIATAPPNRFPPG